jgi:hypothetical protein
VSFLQLPTCATPGCVCSTEDCAIWTFLFYSTVLPERVCSTAACPAPGLVCYIAICIRSCLAYSNLYCPWKCLSTGACAAPVRTMHKLYMCFCAAPESVCLQEAVLHLYLCFSASPEVSVYKSLYCTCTYNVQIVHMLLCCPWKCRSSRACAAPVRVVLCCTCMCGFVLPLEVSVYKSLCCTCTCAFVLPLEVSVYNSLYCIFMCTFCASPSLSTIAFVLRIIVRMLSNQSML